MNIWFFTFLVILVILLLSFAIWWFMVDKKNWPGNLRGG
jgi:hypothetical protein